jgi:ligand-binding sensor domain-containing protein/two-component sensor histidine kinase
MALAHRLIALVKCALSTNRRLFAFLVMLLSSSLALAERLPARIYTAADGLGSSFVTHSMRDSRGFLWFATRDGLSRFDGQQFTTYQLGTKDAPPGIEHILETRRGIYWISTTGGLYRYDPKVVPKESTKSGGRLVLNAKFISGRRGSFFEDRDGKLWLAGSGLSRVDEAEGNISFSDVDLDLAPTPTTTFAILDFLQGSDGSFWIVTTWGLVRLLLDGRKIYYKAESPGTDLLISAAEDSVGRIWLSRSTGVYVIKPESVGELQQRNVLIVRNLDSTARLRTESEVHLPEVAGEVFKYTVTEEFGNNTKKFLFKSADGHIWISSLGGIIEFDGQYFRAVKATLEVGGGTARMVEDVGGDLWLGGEKGLVRISRRGLMSFDASDGLNNLNIQAIGESRDGVLYVAGAGFYVSLFDGKQFQTARPPLPLNSRALWASKPVFLDSQNEWWFLTTEKLYRFPATSDFALLADGHPLAVYDTHNTLKGRHAFHIFEDRRAGVWVSSRAGPDADKAHFGLSRFTRQEQQFYSFSAAENFPTKKSASAFAEDENGDLYIGFYEGGLVRYSGGRFTDMGGPGDLPTGFITALHIDRSGSLWVATAMGGVCRIERYREVARQFTLYTTENGLSSNNARSITEDNFGRIYIGTARGVDRIAADSGRIKHYSTDDGLAGDFVNIAYRDSTGALWFGTPNGLSRLEPGEDPEPKPPAVWLSGLRIAGENRAISELGVGEISDLELGANQNNLRIDFFGIDFSASEPLRYEFMLEGADTNWSEPTTERSVNYSNLAAGNYRFSVRAAAPYANAPRTPATVSFTILGPVWTRGWFLALAMLGLCAIVYSFYHYRLRKLLEIERTRTRIATDLHDDIGASLARIALLSEVVKKQNGPADSSSSQRLTRIAEEARGLVDSMSDIVWSIDPRGDLMLTVVARVRSFANDTLGAKGVKWEFDVPKDLHEVHLSSERRRGLYLIFKEAITNIAHHADCGNAWLKIGLSNTTVFVEIADDGRGFPDTFATRTNGNSRGGHGLENLRRRAAELGGQLKIDSSENGTRLMFSLPRIENKSMFMFIRAWRTWTRVNKSPINGTDKSNPNGDYRG